MGSYIYEVQSLLRDDDFQKVTSEADRESLTNYADEFDEWLYSDEAETATAAKIDAKYAKMYRIVFKA